MAIKTLTINAGNSIGPFKPLNGVNGGPWVRAGTYDLSPEFEGFSPPIARLHDTRYNDEDTVDIHCIFPDMSVDADDPANYRFDQTDEHIRSLVELGIDVIYRLGESIEHGRKKYFVNPPKDLEKWAKVASNIVRHYNQGWADGYEWNIQRWEIWNEFDGGGSWTGTTEQYCELYRRTATAIKEIAPDVMVGGPALAHRMDTLDGREFLSYCRDNDLPLDFISWHGYGSHPNQVIERIKLGLDIAKEYGFTGTETHFTEWNYVPKDEDSESILRTRDPRKSREYSDRIAGAEGAAFSGSTLAFMQDTDLDIACYYVAMGGIFRLGMFDRYMVPTKQYYAFKAFKAVAECGTRVETSGGDLSTGLGVVAGISREKQKTAVLASNFDDPESRFQLKISDLQIEGSIRCREFVVDEHHELVEIRDQLFNSGNISLTIDLPAPSVRLVLFDQI